jgi:ArsR family transcriptional regulator
MQQPVNLFKALGDETRLRILSLLLTEGELCVCDLIATLKLPQSTVSRHLAYLRKTGWVNDRRCGIWMYYSIADRGGCFQESLTAFLRQHLAELPATSADRSCLESFAKDGRCA